MNKIIALAAFVFVAAMSSTGHATYKFCADWRYQYTDQGQGEDYLLHNLGSTGKIAAARSGAFVFKDNVLIWMGSLDTSGCTAALPSPAGNYVLSIVPGLTKGSTKIEIYPNTNKQWRFFNWNLGNLSGTTSAITYRSVFGTGDPLASVAAVMTHLLNQSSMGLVAQTYTVYGEQDCPGGYEACYSSALYLGDDSLGNKMAFNKTTVAHEMGHYVQDRLMGIPNTTYNWEVYIPACRCDHVVLYNREHCLQSFEKVSTAELEGFAQFYAADLFNNPAQTDAWFAYYKEFLIPGIGVASPPVKLNVLNGYKWNLTFCTSDHDQRGVELDWQTFLYELKNKGTQKYSYDNLRDVWKQACGAAFCDNSDNATYNQLALSVIYLYGLENAKTAYWATTASKHIAP